eukprot:6204298-Pleurochrysis_carterae.AAC.1
MHCLQLSELAGLVGVSACLFTTSKTLSVEILFTLQMPNRRQFKVFRGIFPSRARISKENIKVYLQARKIRGPLSTCAAIRWCPDHARRYVAKTMGCLNKGIRCAELHRCSRSEQVVSRNLGDFLCCHAKCHQILLLFALCREPSRRNDSLVDTEYAFSVYHCRVRRRSLCPKTCNICFVREQLLSSNLQAKMAPCYSSPQNFTGEKL